MKQPNEIVFITEANSSNLDLTNQCWYSPEKEKVITQYKYIAKEGIINEDGAEYGIHPDSTRTR